VAEKFEVVQVGTGSNEFAMLVEADMLDRLQLMREIDERMTEAFLEATDTATGELLGDLDNWQPVGILNTARPPITWMPSPPPAAYEDADWCEAWELINSMFSAALKEWENGMVADRELQNSRARLFWRAQRRMSLDETMAKIRTRYGTALEALGRL
jgi:hypothetical protein